MTINRNLSILAGGVSSTGILNPSNGGTGLSSLTANYIPFGNGTSAFNSSSALQFDGNNLLVGSNTAGYGTLNIQRYASVPYASFTITDQATPANAVGIYLRQIAGSPAGISTAGAPIAFYVGGPGTTEVARIFASGGVSIGNTTDPGAGNLRLNSTSNGIYFGSSSKLNDYQEGTFTPNQGSAVTVVGAYSSSGTYTKIGNLVTVTAIQSGATSIAVAASGILFSNAPFTVNSSGSRYSGTCALQFTAACGAIAVGATTNVYSAGTLSGGDTIVTTITYQV